MPKHNKIVLAILLTGLLTGCSSLTGDKGNTASLIGLQEMEQTPQGKGLGRSSSEKSKIRVLAIKESALSIGAQSGLASRAKEINLYLARHAKDLDKIYNFNALLIENNVLPPVLVEGRNTLNLDTPDAIRLADRTYKIAKQAHFVTTPPNWHQYIWMDYKLPARPDNTMLPKNKEEKAAWKKYTADGWQKGHEQAETIFADNLARLKMDYMGMILYRKLLAQNIVSPPYVSHTDLGVTGDSNQIYIDDKALRITALPALKPNSKVWKAAVSKSNDALKHLRMQEKLVNSANIEITDEAWQPVIPKS